MEPGFDEFLHVPARLSIVALLAPADWVEFAFLRDALGTSDSALSKHLSALANAGYVAVRKENEDGVRRTRVHLTSEGRQAFRQHAAALERLVAAARAPEPRPQDEVAFQPAHGAPPLTGREACE